MATTETVQYLSLKKKSSLSRMPHRCPLVTWHPSSFTRKIWGKRWDLKVTTMSKLLNAYLRRGHYELPYWTHKKLTMNATDASFAADLGRYLLKLLSPLCHWAKRLSEPMPLFPFRLNSLKNCNTFASKWYVRSHVLSFRGHLLMYVIITI